MKKNDLTILQSFGITAIVVLGMLLFSPMSLLLGNFMGKEPATLIYYLLAIGVPFWIISAIRKSKINSKAFNFKIENKKIIPFIIIAAVALLFGLIFPITNLIPIPESIKQVFLSFSNQTGIFAFILMVFAAPILEELIFRAIILDGLLKKYTPITAIIVSSFLFGLVHLNPWQFVTGFVIGIFSGWVYYRTQSISYSIIIHATANFSGYLVRYFVDMDSTMDKTLTELYGGLLNLVLAICGSVLLVLVCIYFLNKEFAKRKSISEGKNGIFLLILYSTISISSCSPEVKSEFSEIQNYLNALTTKDFSGAILVAKEDSIIDYRAYGYANIEHKIKNEVHTKFNLASITKMITAVGVLKLYDEGKISLEEPIGKYLPSYSNEEVKNSVTIHQLLSHTSGLNNFYTEERFLATDKLQYKNVSDFVPLFENDTLLFKPGSKYHYSASGFVLLGLIIEEVSEQNYYDYIKNAVFKPAQMENASVFEIDAITENRADGYTSHFGEMETLKKNESYLSKASPAGFHYATAEDLFNFSKALRKGKLLKKETVKLMHQPKTKGYNTHIGYGVDIDSRYNQKITGHSGGWYGIHNELLHFTKDQYTVIILSNQDDDGKKGASGVKNFFIQLFAKKN